MTDRSGTSTSEQPPTYSSPSWCDYPGKCRGEHGGTAHGTVATGGLPPKVDGPEAPSHNTAVVRAQYPEAVDLPPGVALFGSWAGGTDADWQVELTVKEARVLLEGLTAAIAEAESD